jgi:molybdenum cofactor biosynthesis enzyme MoaA
LDGADDFENIEKVLRDSYAAGARSLSLSGSGEPTLSPLSVERTLEIVAKLRLEDKQFTQVNLYTNGLKFGVVDNWWVIDRLKHWKKLGLTHIYLTLHSLYERRNAEAYGLINYPMIQDVLQPIFKADLKVRANIVLTKRNVHGFEELVNGLHIYGVYLCSAWPVRSIKQDIVDEKLAPTPEQMKKVAAFCKENNVVLHSGENTEYAEGDKLTLFPNGLLSSSWCSS